METPQKATTRLASLDILRGFDLFLLLFFQPVFYRLGKVLGWEWLDPILHQFEHEAWVGFRFWDLIMPLFLFMAGASMPFSFAKFKADPDKKRVYKKVVKRFIILFLLGMVVQGNLLGLDPSHIYFYVNTLQAIATGYLIAAIILLNCSVKTQIIATVSLLVIYTLPMMFCGDYTLEGNFAYKVDTLLMGRFQGDPSYTWIWSSLTFGVTVMLGAFSGEIIRMKKETPQEVVKWLLITGVALVAAAFIWSFEMPIIKRIWSGSMTLLAGGYCFLLMGLFFYWIDYKGHKRGLEWLKVYGMNSITAYMLAQVINFRCIATSLFHGLEQYLGDFYPIWISFVHYSIIFIILKHMYDKKIFLKI